MDKTQFINDFNGFYVKIQKEDIDATFADIATLYAIYRTDVRTIRILDAKGAKQEKVKHGFKDKVFRRKSV